MKSALIIINSYNNYSGYLFQINRLVEEFKKVDLFLDVKKTDEIEIIVFSNILISLKKYDFIIFYDKDIYLAKILEKEGFKVFNNSSAIEICDNKFLTHIVLSNNGINMPKTIPSLLCYSNVTNISQKFIDNIENNIKYPLIFKKVYGSLGKEVYLLNNRNELIEYATKFIHESYIIQDFIESSEGRDVRIICVGGKFLSAMLRKNDKDFRSNIGYGGKGYSYTPSDEFIQTAEKAASIIGLDYCGIDLLFGKDNKPILCEVNSNAFFEEFEKVTGVNVAANYVSYIMNIMYN